MPRPTAKDAELILRLFEMRREPEVSHMQTLMEVCRSTRCGRREAVDLLKDLSNPAKGF